MQLSLRRFAITREALLADVYRFRFASAIDTADYLDTLLRRISASYDTAAQPLDHKWRQVLHERLTHNVAVLGSGPGTTKS